MGVSVVDEAEEDGEDLFHLGEAWGMVGMGHLFLLGEGRLRWPLTTSFPVHATHI